MDADTYATIAEVCARLAGRLSDDPLDALRSQYGAGEWGLGDDTLLLNLAYEGVGITGEERDLIRSFLGDPDNPDLLDVPVIAEVPPLSYDFGPTGPADAPDPTRADLLLSSEARRRQCKSLYRAWRTPLAGAPGAATWLYVLRVADGTDELKMHSGLTSKLWTSLREQWQLEVVAENAAPTPYQAAALTAAHPVWTA